MENQRDEKLWRMAQKRAAFKRHFVSYLGVNIFLWTLWYFTQGREMEGGWFEGHLPWPAWASLGWGVGLFFNFIGAYSMNKQDWAEKEYEDLKRKHNP
jgi:hypothetical protein